MSSPETNRIAARVREHLRNHDLNGISLDIVDSEIREEESWWDVPVHPSIEPEKHWQYYEVLADAEEKLADEGIKVFLRPSDPLARQPA